jgi:phosphoribosyl-ATP pyrophosphohydrolase
MSQHPFDLLWTTIQERKDADPSVSYTAKLLARGRPKVAQKVGEEGVEVVIAALAEDRDALARESADLLYHLQVLWTEVGLDPSEVWRVLEQRQKK